MYNWRLLLFAFFAVFQPIASFAERNLVDGRQQCCDHRFSRDTGRIHGNYPFKLPVEDRRLNYRRENREIRRDDFRNERTPLNPASDAFRDGRERQFIRVSPEFGFRSSQTDVRRINNRIFSQEVRGNPVWDINSNSVERKSARNKLSRNNRIPASGRRDIRTSENVLHYRRQMPEDATETRRVLEVERSEIRRENDQRRSSVQNDRRSNSNLDRTNDNERRLKTRGDFRNQRITMQRSTRSVDRFTRDTTEYRRSSLENFRVTGEERPIGNERIEFRGTQRRELDRKLSSQFLARHRDSQERHYKKEKSRESGNDARDERRMFEFRAFNKDARRNTERSSLTERQNNSPIRKFMSERRERVLSRFATNENRRERANVEDRMLTTRPEKSLSLLNLRNIEVRDDSRKSADERLSERLGTFRISPEESRYERRYVDFRKNARSFDGSQMRNERRERRDVNQRAHSLEREHLIRTVRSRIGNERSYEYRTLDKDSNNERSFKERATTDMNRFASRNIEEAPNSRSKQSRSDFRVRKLERRSLDNHMRSTSEIQKIQINNMNQDEVKGINWHNLMYTVQAIYICAILLPMLMDKKDAKTKTMFWNWATQKTIKVD